MRCKGRWGLFEIGITLGQVFLVQQQVLEITVATLREQAIHKFAPQFAAVVNEFDIVGRDHHGGVLADVFGYFFIRRLVVLDTFLAFPPQAGNLFLQACHTFEAARYPEPLCTFLNIIELAALEIAFGVTEIINGIEQVGLTGPVQTGNTRYRAFKSKGPVSEITKLGKRYFLQVRQVYYSIGMKTIIRLRVTFVNILEEAPAIPVAAAIFKVFIKHFCKDFIFSHKNSQTVQTQFGKETYLTWYESMLLQRRFEEKAGQLYGMQKIRGFCHLYIGQEAVSAGIISAIREDDNMITAYRDHGLAIAKGVSAKSCMAELYGKATGCTGGKGGSMHFFSKEKRFFGGHGIVGGQIGLGAGIAFADNYNNNDRITVCMFGDGAARQGILHETFNMAVLWQLPVIFICENNHYAMGTSVERTSKVLDIYRLADAYDMPGDSVDGMDPEAVHTAIERAAKRAREKGGPTFLEIKTYRYRGHSMSDPAKYRSKEEVEEYKEHDPIDKALRKIKENNWATEEEIEAINERVKNEVEESVTFAEESPYPEDSALYEDIYVQKDYPFIMD